MTLAAVVLQAAAELGIADCTGHSESLAAILQRCMDEIGLSDPLAIAVAHRGFWAAEGVSLLKQQFAK